MITEAQLDQVMGTTLYDRDGDRIGKIGQIYLDDDSGRPSWMTVNTGLFGASESFVPLRDAELDDRGVRVPYEKAQVKDAPHAADDGHLDEAHQGELYRYYGLESGGREGDAPAPEASGGPRAAADSPTDDSPAADSPTDVGRGSPGRSTDEPTTERPSDLGRSNPGPSVPTSADRPAAATGRIDRTDEGEVSGVAPGTAAGAVVGAAAGAGGGGGSVRAGSHAEPGTADGHGTDGHGTDEHRTDEHRADEQRTDEQRTDEHRADEHRGRHAADGPVDGGVTAGADQQAGTPAGSADQPVGARMRLRRYVVTEQRTITVPVTHEEVRLERVDDDPSGEGTPVSEAEVVAVDLTATDQPSTTPSDTGAGRQ